MERPVGAVDVARKSYKGLTCAWCLYYDGTNDVSNYPLDVIFGGALARWSLGLIA